MIGKMLQSVTLSISQLSVILSCCKLDGRGGKQPAMLFFLFDQAVYKVHPLMLTPGHCNCPGWYDNLQIQFLFMNFLFAFHK